MLHKQTWPHLLDNEENELQIVPQSIQSMERHAWCPTYFQKQIQPPSSKLLQKVAICAGKDRAHWRDKDQKVLLLDDNSLDKFGHPLVRRKDGCIMSILCLCPLMEINRHSWPERCLLEVNTLNILMILIPHFLMAKSWLALPSYAAVSSRWNACTLPTMYFGQGQMQQRSQVTQWLQYSAAACEKQAQLLCRQVSKTCFPLRARQKYFKSCNASI